MFDFDEIVSIILSCCCSICTIATRPQCNFTSGVLNSAILFLLTMKCLRLISCCLIVALSNWCIERTQMESKNGVVSSLRRVAHLSPCYYNTESFYDLGNAVRSLSHAGADEVFGGD